MKVTKINGKKNEIKIKNGKILRGGERIGNI
jgi:hypothetical protein